MKINADLDAAKIEEEQRLQVFQNGLNAIQLGMNSMVGFCIKIELQLLSSILQVADAVVEVVSAEMETRIKEEEVKKVTLCLFLISSC